MRKESWVWLDSKHPVGLAVWRRCMNDLMRRYILVSAALWIYSLPSVVSSQQLIEANVADPTDMRSALINPAASSLTHSHVLVGMKVFHGGFLNSNALGIRNQFFNISLSDVPYLHTGLSLSAYHLGTPIYAKTAFGLGMSKGFFDKLYVGGKLEAIHSGFNEKEFDLVDENDPVFSQGTGKTVLSVGSGLLFCPSRTLNVGFSVHHLNQPNISLIDENVHESLLTDLGVSYAYSYFRLSAGVMGVGSDFYPNLYLSTDYWDFVHFRVGYEYSGLTFGCHFQVTRKIELNYDLNIPLSGIMGESLGSHQVNLVFYLKKPEEPPADFDVFVEKDSLFVLERWFDQHVEPGIPTAVVEKSLEATIPEYMPDESTQHVVSTFEAKYYTKRYRAFLDSLSKIIRIDSPAAVRIVAADEDIERAVGIKDYLTNMNPEAKRFITVVSTKTIEDIVSLKNLELIEEKAIGDRLFKRYVSDKRTTVRISSGNDVRVDIWQLQIGNDAGDVIRQYTGGRRVPSRLQWDWRDSEGKFVEPGWYRVVFRWKGKEENLRESPAIPVQIVKRSQHVMIHVSEEMQDLDQESDVIDIILK